MNANAAGADLVAVVVIIKVFAMTIVVAVTKYSIVIVAIVNAAAFIVWQCPN